jgi:bacterioferritin (cytochrome b1)
MADKTLIEKKLNEILESEVCGIVRYLPYPRMIKGPNRIPSVKVSSTREKPWP